MLKLKTLRSASKRFKKTASGSFKYKHAHSRHILTKKSMNKKRHLRKKNMISKNNLSTILKYLPYA